MNYIGIFVAFYGILLYFTIHVVARESIIGGTVTTIDNFRYLASILEVDHGHICGGAIIGEHFILSAAHCFMYSDNTFKAKRVYALMGSSNLTNKEYPAVHSEVEKIYVPNDYDASDVNTTADIAVLKLKDPLELKNYRDLKSVKLERNRANTYSGKKAHIAGWGWNQVTLNHNQVVGHRFDSLLRSMTADVLSHQQCQQEHSDLQISVSHLCARVEQHENKISGVCFGDNGGPLVHDGAVVGILSLIPNTCNERRRSAIYTRVSHYLVFIRNAKTDHVTNHMRVHVFHP